MRTGAALVSAAAGILFALGLGVSGMTDPAKVLGFLDVAGTWDPSLAFVMGGAVLVTAAAWRFRRGLARPPMGVAFPDLSRTRIDARLLTGAAIFGVGWGLAGYCPGPALTSLASGATSVIVFVGAMFAGMSLFTFVDGRLGGR